MVKVKNTKDLISISYIIVYKYEIKLSLNSIIYIYIFLFNTIYLYANYLSIVSYTFRILSIYTRFSFFTSLFSVSLSQQQKNIFERGNPIIKYKINEDVPAPINTKDKNPTLNT